MRLALAAAVSAVVVLAAPFMGQLQSILRQAFPTRQYVLLVGGGVVLAIAAIVLVALRRIRERRAMRFAAMLLAFLIGFAYTSAMSTGYPEVDAVERVHFIEYGVIAVLFYRVWRRAGDLSTIVMPILCGFLVGTLDEWLQWFIPVRVGEAHDVFLNFTSLICGLLFGVALEPPPAFSMRLRGPAVARIGVAAAIVGLVFAAFVSQVHLGYEIAVPDIGRFRSHYTLEQLNDLQGRRNAAWAAAPPLRLRRLSREDQYLDEGLWHVRRRNRYWNENDFNGAWRENLILERFFVPVLDRPTYASPQGNRWPAEHRADAASRLTPAAAPFASDAEPYPIATWNKSIFWLAAGGAALCLIGLSRVAARR